MSSLIVIRITPQKPVDAMTFAGYLNAAGLGQLTITAYALNYDSVDNQPKPGVQIGQATNNPAPATAGWTQDPLNANAWRGGLPAYPAGVTSGIFQQVDYAPSLFSFIGDYELESVATAIIEIPSAPDFENLRIEATWGAQGIPITTDYYDVSLATGPTPDLSTWNPVPTPQPDLWAAIPTTSLYISLPKPPTKANPLSLQLPSDGTPPNFDELLTAVKAVLADDPGAAITVTPTADGVAGGTTLTFASTDKIAIGMSATGAGIPDGTVVAGVNRTTNVVTFDQGFSGAVPGPVKFTPWLGALTFDQCQNIAYEIVWSQLPPLPAIPSGDSLAGLYTNPPNDGLMMNGSTPNPNEGDRQQFEAQLKSYYATADTTANQLTNYVFALSCAVACEEMSLAANVALLEFPVNLGQPGSSPLDASEVILTGLCNLTPNIVGVPAAFFYALGATMPTQNNVTARYQTATGRQLGHLLSDFTTAINAETIFDSEAFVTPGFPKINAAQAARQLVAIGVPPGSATPIAPLDTVELVTVADAPSGSVLKFNSIPGVKVGTTVSGTNVPPKTTVKTITPGTPVQVTLSQPLLDDVPMGSSVIFTPSFTAELQSLIQAWLTYPTGNNLPPGVPSSQAYQTMDDAVGFWPGAATSYPDAFLSLVLSALTEGYMLPKPFDISLGDQITTVLLKPILNPPTVATLASVTAQQWTNFFQANPVYLPQPSTGNTSAQIDAFLANVKKFFTVAHAGPSSSIAIAASSATAAGGNVLNFASTAGITPPTLPGVVPALTWSVTDATHPTAIQSGTTVTAVTATTVTVSPNLPNPGPGVSQGDSIIFTPSYSGAHQEALPLLQEPSTDWLQACITAYTSAPLSQPYAGFGGVDRFNIPVLQSAAATVFPDDLTAQNWLVDALATLDALYLVILNAGLGVSKNLEFSIAEALYARGFKSAADMTELSSSDFQQALIGTVAYDYATALYTSASAIAPPSTPPTCGPFHPINLGSLTNCIPPECLSPLGPVEYLHELLQLSPSSTCEIPLTSTASNTLGSIVSQRRGSIGTLLASCANLETQLPLIDIANECLEYLGASATPAEGTIYQTSSDAVAGLSLWHDDPCANEHEKEPKPPFHDPCRVYSALPEYSTPATPVAENCAVDHAVYDKLKCDFSSCYLPYSQAIDVSRTYLRHFRSCRFEEMRTFRKCITEFVLHPSNDPIGFESHLWRYPVRIDIAIEYLGITPEEYGLIFQGPPAPPCAIPQDTDTSGPIPANPDSTDTQPASNLAPSDESNALTCWQLYGFSSPGGDDGGDEPWTDVVASLPEFLRRTCLSYCEFIDLWKCGYVSFGNGCHQNPSNGPNVNVASTLAAERNPGDGQQNSFPDCEPCCLEDYCLQFPENPGESVALCQLAVFIRLWRKLNESDCFCYSFDQLRDICDVLQLYVGGAINPDFIRQFAAFQMLRDHFHMELADPHDKIAQGTIDSDRTQLLALWVGPTAPKWNWAVKQLIEKVEHYAKRRYKGQRRSAEFVKLLVSNLDPLSSLCGFDPTSATDNWHASPTHTLRFAEVLAKIYASNFSVGDLIYLFTAQEHLDGDDPFPLQEQDEALDFPLGLPEDSLFSLTHLRRKVLEAYVDDEDIDKLHWKEIEVALQEDLGFAQSAVLSFGQHFLPGILEHAGYSVNSSAKQFVSGLSLKKTVPAMWNTPADGPFQYDSTAKNLWTQLPLTDEAVIDKLIHVHSLNPQEQTAVQDLYFQPRAMLAQFALLFSDFASAEQHLIEERDEHERWNYFRRQFALCWRRCRIIAEHLSHHVADVTGQEFPEGDAPALLILRQLFADENKATTSWEKDDGTTPSVTWTPPPSGGALAALLGLSGTGLIAEYTPEGGPLVWRSLCGTLSTSSRELDEQNCPVPCVLPAMGASLTPEQMKYVSIHNGFLMKDSSGAWLGGGQGFELTWHGAMLVENEGTYEFWGGAPTPGDEKPDFEAAEHRRWRMILKRGQRTWIPLSHHWMGEEEHRSSSVPLKRGIYELTVELVQPTPEFPSEEQVRAQRTGFQVKYSGPDTEDRRMEIPHHRLFQVMKNEPLGQGIATLSTAASAFLGDLYSSSLRDIRRTYQRAFKALLFAHRFALSATHSPHGTSELGYMLAHPSNLAGFAGASYYPSGGAYSQHLANIDFNFLPLLDDYYAPAQDQRTNPLLQRTQAMFDWWERIFDYTVVRHEVRQRSDRHLWHLFEEAEEKQPANPDFLLRHMGADSRHWPLDLRFYQGENVPVYSVSSIDLEDDRWTVRAWHADQWLRALECSFTVKDITVARPDLWAATDPSAKVSGETEPGNANLSTFLYDGCLGNGEPRRYEDVKRLNDGLREGGRNALVAYLCHMNRVLLPWLSGQYAQSPRDLSDLLLLDVEAGICEKASRIDEAITAVQNFVLRARLHLEPSFTVTHEFCRTWDREFATFRIWQACKRRHLYKENWIEWSELEKARDVESFRFLESKLSSSELTVAVPGGLEWWPDQRPPSHNSLEALQKREPSGIQVLSPLPTEPTPGPREGFSLFGTPERDARPSWLTALESPTSSSGGTSSSSPNAGPQAATSAPCCTDTKLPLWMEAAIRMGKRFIRIAAAGVPPAAMSFEPHKNHAGSCVICCEECGCTHPALIDEYYFWLIDSHFYEPPAPPTGITTVEPDNYEYGYQDDFYDPAQQEAAFWQDTTQLPELLAWTPQPTVRLAWCRVHNGEFQQPRRSQKGLAIQVPSGGSPTDLTFVGRTADSLIFSVNNGVVTDGYSDPEAPGFRYNLACDDAVVLPLLSAPPAPPAFLQNLPAYPYFVYVAPGKPLFPLSMFSPSVTIAQALRSHCRFESALKWYRLVFDPLNCDCTWIYCGTQHSGNGERPSTPPADTATPPRTAATAVDQGNGDGKSQGCCCDSTNITCAEAQHRAIILLYLETLREWGDAVMRHGHSREAEQHARQIFDTAELILGKRPINVRMPCPANPATVANFKPAFAPLNPRLLDLYDVIKDRLDLIRACIDSRRLTTGKGCRDQMPYFGDNSLREGWRTAIEPCAEESEWCHLQSPYRFMFLIQKALEYASKTQELGGALLAAYEKGDAEYLSSLRALHERELLTLGLDAKKDQWRDADWQIAALQETKAVNQSNLVYTNGLINAGPEGKIDDELQYENQTSSAISLRSTANITEGIGEAMRFIPDFVLGGAGFGGSPVAISWIPLGTKIGDALEAVARIMNNSAEIDSMNASFDLTEAQWLRRLNEWMHQTQTLAIEIQQVERQILGAQRRRAQALSDLNSHVRQMEQSAEVENFLRDKFTADDLYLFLQKETAGLYYQTYELALHAARQAEYACNLERGHTTRQFIPDCAWNNLHDGLLAGDRLSVALRHMEKAYLDENLREYELTKTFSLRLHFPMEFLRLRTTGVCEIDIPEWMFDLDFPGQYMRRIKTLSVTIPCVTGPFTGVHCRMTLLSSMTRINPRLTAPVHECCCPPKPCGCECAKDAEPAWGYEPCPDDPRIVRQYGAREAIATSTGQNDTGLFELNFNDERYLPFEYMGAVSRWRIELPKENNYFPLHTLSDFMMTIRHTAREGGELLRRAANHIAHHHLPGDGWCVFDVRHEFPDAWQLFENKKERRLDIRLDRNMFPFVPGAREIWISNMAILFSAYEEDCDCPKIEGCPCPEHGKPAHRTVEFLPPCDKQHDGECKTVVSCFASEEWPDLYSGFFDAHVGPLSGNGTRHELEFRFAEEGCKIEQVFLLCRYSLEPCACNYRQLGS